MYAYEKKPSFFGGLIGALIGAAIGAAVWMFVAKAGYIVSLVGLLIAFLAAKGYDICKGPQNSARIVVVILCVILAVVGGNYGAVYWAIEEQYDENIAAYGGAALISKEDFRDAIMSTPEVSDALMEDTLKGLGFAALGCAGVIASGIKKRKQRKAEEAALAQAEYEQSMYEGYAEAPAYDPNAYAEPAYYDENGYPVESAPAESEYAYEPAPAAYAVEEETPAYSAPASADSGYSAGYTFSSMRTAAPARPAAPAPAAKKNPFVKPEFSNNFNTGKAAPKEPAKPANGPQTFYSDK